MNECAFLTGYSTLASNVWRGYWNWQNDSFVMFILATSCQAWQAWNACKQQDFIYFTLLWESMSSPFSYPNANKLHRRRAWKPCQITFKSQYGCLSYCSPTFPRLFNLTVLSQAQDKMVNPCSGGLSEQSTDSLEYGISLQIPSAHLRCDPINARICVFHFHPSPHRYMIRI